MTQRELTAELIEQWTKKPNSDQEMALLTEISDSFQDGSFPHMDNERKKLFSSHILDTWSLVSEQIRLRQLRLLRIILRDKNSSDLECFIPILTFLTHLAKLSTDNSVGKEMTKIVLESEKCLVNLLFNSAKARAAFHDQKRVFEQLLSRVRSIIAVFGGVEKQFVDFEYLSEWSLEEVEELLLYDLKIAFTTTALIRKLRNKCMNDSNSTTVFIDVLIYSLEKMSASVLATKYADEALNTLFNLYHDCKVFELEAAQRCADQCARIVKNAQLDVQTKQNAVNLLSVLACTLPALCPKVAHVNETSIIVQDGYDMSFLNALLNFFEEQIDKYEKKQIIPEFLAIHLTILSHLCSEHKSARRFCRAKVLPPLKEDDVRRRPEEGDTFRNKMVRLMSSTSQCGEVAAEFLFVLCKRSVNRLMKYCGFGHSAGLLANYGFLGQATVAHRRPSDSEDSETDEYKRVEEKINPVTGCIPPPEQHEEWRRQIDLMSEEQKEFEMMKLVDCMDKMMEQGLIRPGVIGEDGELRQAKHVAELIKDVQEENGSDED